MGSCGSCTAPAGALTLCPLCVARLRLDLTEVAGLIPDSQGTPGYLRSLPDEVNITRSRWDRPHVSARPQPADPHVLPYRPHAAESLWVLTTTLTAWVRELGGPPGSPQQLAVWLLENTHRITIHLGAGQLTDEITYAVRQARNAIDHYPTYDRLFLGWCACRTELLGKPHKPTVFCPACGTEYQVSERQAQLRTQARDLVGTATEVAALLSATGLRVTPSMIRGYAHRGRLTPADEDARGHPQYRVGDALNALAIT